MAVLRIVRDWDDDASVLRQRARKIRRVDAAVLALLDNMVDTMRDAGGVGLAAPQVGVGLQAIVVEYPRDDEVEDSPLELYQIVNPEVVKRNGAAEGQEGCLSLPGLVADVTRAERVTVKGLDRNGRAIRLKACGWLARVFQHEVDHTHGVLMLERASQVYEVQQAEDGTTTLLPVPRS